MIINTGQRTDIPAFYAEWFANRLKEGFVCVRNPYNPSQVSRYLLDPSVVDVIGFCTKNPSPMFPYMELLRAYRQYWFLSITPYGKDIEPNVPDKHLLIEHFKHLSMQLGVNSIGWRYDPIFLSERYSKDYHLKAFEQIATALEGYTKTVVISFVDLYPKVRRNFPELKALVKEDRLLLGEAMIEIARSRGMTLKPCAEGRNWLSMGQIAVDVCLSAIMRKPLENACMYRKRRGQEQHVPVIFPVISAPITAVSTFVNIVMPMQNPLSL